MSQTAVVNFVCSYLSMVMVSDWHTENAPCAVTSFLINFLVKSWILFEKQEEGKNQQSIIIYESEPQDKKLYCCCEKIFKALSNTKCAIKVLLQIKAPMHFIALTLVFQYCYNSNQNRTNYFSSYFV